MSRPILIAGPTASGKSDIALALAERHRGMVINADALQVYEGWRVLSARPSEDDEARVPHRLYGHVGMTRTYSVGDWLRELRSVLDACRDTGLRPIIVGGTGLYFHAATDGLSDIPAVPAEVRAEGDRIRETEGAAGLLARLGPLDPAILARIDRRNPARLQRAWEVATATGRPLSAWQTDAPPPLLPLEGCDSILLEADRHWLNEKIARRMHLMVANGALDECSIQRKHGLDMTLPSARAIGAAELMAHLGGLMPLDQAIERAIIATRQYAKRQRTWFRSRMRDWKTILVSEFRHRSDTIYAADGLISPGG